MDDLLPVRAVWPLGADPLNEIFPILPGIVADGFVHGGRNIWKQKSR
jgi:hypothetical protein